MFNNATDEMDAKQRMKELEEMAFVDPLTSLPNRRFLLTTIEGRLDEFKRYGWPFGLLFMDVDHFKKVNDTHGHDIAASYRDGMLSEKK